jgi:hypothetical protein
MRFRCLLICLALFAVACGNKPERKLPNKALEYFSRNAGCLNQLGPEIDKFLVGEIRSDELERTSFCLAESLRLFKRNIKGSHAAGYTQQDIQAFVQKFLMTDSVITPELVSHVFEVKASLFGGTGEILLRAEVDRMIELIETARGEAQKLLPLLASRRHLPTARNLLRLADSLAASGARLGQKLGSAANPPLKIESARSLAGEVGKLFRWNVRLDDALWIFSLKSMLIGGSTEEIESALWPQFLDVAGQAGGMLVAYQSRSGADYELLDELLHRATALFSVREIGFEQVDHLLDRAPLTYPAPLSLGIIKQAMRAVVVHLFGAGQVDARVFGQVHDLLHSWILREDFLEKTYWSLNENGVSPAAFVRSAQSWRGTGDDGELDRLIFLAEQFHPMFGVKGDGQIWVGDGLGLTRFHMRQLNWIRPVVEHLLGVYGNGSAVEIEGFKQLLSDFGDLGFQLGAIDNRIPDFQLKRFREANLFTPVSNGDKWIDANEGTYFLTDLISSGPLTARILAAAARCPNLGGDPYGGVKYSAVCARRAFFDQWKENWDHFPGLRDYYGRIEEKEKREFEEFYEKAARPYGYSQEPITTTDLQGFSTVAHYLETLMLRADLNRDQIVDLPEAMSIFPVFKMFLAEVGDLDPNDEELIEAVYTFTIKHRRPPGKDPAGIAEFLAWRLLKPHWKLDASRTDVFATIGALNDASNGSLRDFGKALQTLE